MQSLVKNTLFKELAHESKSKMAWLIVIRSFSFFTEKLLICFYEVTVFN